MSESTVLLIIGVIVILAAWVPLFLRGTFISLPMIAVALGTLLGMAAIPGMENPLAVYGEAAESIAEFALLVAVLGAGLRIDRRFSFRGWSSVWRLLFIVMPLSIAIAAAIGNRLLGYPIGLSILLGAITSPTDPVLAASVQAGPPGVGEEGEPKFALTAEAGLNDGLAFPFVYLGLAVLGSHGIPSLAHWFLVRFLWNIAGGVVVGVGLGAALMGLNRMLPEGWHLRDTNSGIVSVGLALVAYGCADAVYANGLVAVFCEAATIRNMSRSFEYSRSLTLTAEQFERVAMVILMVLLGLAIAAGLLSYLRWTDFVFALLLALIRPIAVAVSFIGSTHDRRTRGALGFFGIRGIASLFYAAFLLNHDVKQAQAMTAVIALVALFSVVFYGMTTDIVTKRLLHHPPEESPGPG